MTAPALVDAERAAVMVMLLDEDQAAAILRELGPDELRLLGEKMIALGDIGPEQITQAISGFVDNSQRQGIPAHGRTDRVHSLMHRAVGEVKADSLMQRILPPEAEVGPALQLARWLTPQALIPLVRDEHPQALAVLLVQLDPDVAAAVLHALPADQQSQVVHRVATLGQVAPDALTILESALEQRITQSHGKAALTMGGPRDAAEIINRAGKAAEKRILPDITRRDKVLARQIEAEMFKFEHLFALDAQAMGTLLREVESETLIDALKGTAEEQREAFFRAMSSRAADGVRDEIEARGRLKLAEAIEAQKQMVAIARRLAGEGLIQFGNGGGGDDYV
ncbi:MAG: flagellar motor switch protein FliG [Proteobacteria bacterium]|nr:flagellar motor switch protein FliG [Pseudomonadota bacterium]